MTSVMTFWAETERDTNQSTCEFKVGEKTLERLHLKNVDGRRIIKDQWSQGVPTCRIESFSIDCLSAVCSGAVSVLKTVPGVV